MENTAKVVILGGTPRSGKTTMAVRLARNGFSRLNFDALHEAIEKGLPEVVNERPHDQEYNSEKLLTFFQTLVQNALWDAEIYGVSTVIDVYDFTPQYLSKLPCMEQAEVYFLGYPGHTGEEIAHAISHWAQPTDWIAGVDHDYLLEVAQRCLSVNEKLVRQCAEYGFTFVDTGLGEGRAAVLDALYHRILCRS